MKTMNERKITMADKSRERNYVDILSDYGLDERQIAIRNKIMTKCFKLMYYLSIVLTAVWLELCIPFQIEIPNYIIALSYFILVVVCQSVYAVMASKQGVINGITATTNSSGPIITVVMVLIYMTFLVIVFLEKGFAFTNENIIMIVFFGIFIINNVIQYLCAKRNFKALDEQGKEDSEEE